MSDRTTAPEKTVDAGHAAPSAKSGPSPAKERIYTVKFHAQEGIPGGKDDIVVHVGNSQNIGRSLRFKREHEIEIPERIMNVIKDAKPTRYEVNAATKDVVARNVDRFSYTVLKVE